MDGGLRIFDDARPVNVTESAFVGSYDTHTVAIESAGHRVTDTIALGTFHILGASKADQHLPATFFVTSPGVALQRTRAAGSDRFGYNVVGDVCDAEEVSFAGNHAQSSLVGIRALAARGGCAPWVSYTAVMPCAPTSALKMWRAFAGAPASRASPRRSPGTLVC